MYAFIHSASTWRIDQQRETQLNGITRYSSSTGYYEIAKVYAVAYKNAKHFSLEGFYTIFYYRYLEVHTRRTDVKSGKYENNMQLVLIVTMLEVF